MDLNVRAKNSSTASVLLPEKKRILAEGQRRNPNPRTNRPLWL